MKQYYKLLVILICSSTINAQLKEASTIDGELLNIREAHMNVDDSNFELSVSAIPKTESNNSGRNLVYKVGDIGFGGVIFYIDESGEHGLVCTFNDQSNNAKWGKKRKVKKNERLSEELHTSKTIFGKKRKERQFQRNDFANRLCKKLKLKFENETYKDWYLPSKEELNLLYARRGEVDQAAIENGGSPLELSYYWSSTEYNYDKSWVQYFSTGKQTVQFKNFPNNVRAIRAF